MTTALRDCYHRPDSPNMDDLFLPERALEVGAEIARGGFGAVHEARLYGVRVCAKVRRDDGADGGAWQTVSWRSAWVGALCPRLPCPALHCCVVFLVLCGDCGVACGCSWLRRASATICFRRHNQHGPREHAVERGSTLQCTLPPCVVCERVWSHGPRSEAVTRC